jgi:hypothetical protein
MGEVRSKKLEEGSGNLRGFFCVTYVSAISACSAVFAVSPLNSYFLLLTSHRLSIVDLAVNPNAFQDA